MAGYHAEENYPGPYRPSAAPFDTMNMPGPQRAAQFDTVNLAAGPHRVPQFDTMTLGAPVRGQDPPNGKATGGEGRNVGYYSTDAAAPGAYPGGGGGGQTPMIPALELQSATGGGGRMHTGLVVANLSLRAAALVSLIIGVAVLASDSQPLDDDVTVSFSTFSSTKYALGAAILGIIYSIYETISAAVRLATGHLLLPRNISLFISYIGDQVVIVLLLTGASAAATTFKDLHDLQNSDGISYCELLGDLCKQGVGAIAMIFLGFCFLAASLVISSFCFYKKKS